MDAVLLALTSAALFGGMTCCAAGPALAGGASPELGALWTVLPAFGGDCPDRGRRSGQTGISPGFWPFALAGLLGPGLSQTFFTLAVRDAGPARAPGDRRDGSGLRGGDRARLPGRASGRRCAGFAGALLIVGGGVLLVAERGRPRHVKRIGFAFALLATLVFAVRDNLVRWLAVDTDVEPGLAATPR